MLEIRIKTDLDKQIACEQVRRLPLKPMHEVIIRKYDPKRSNPANALFHKWVAILADETGYSAHDMKTILKCQFLGFKEIRYNGEVYKEPVRTRSLTKLEFLEFMNNVRQLASTMGVQLPNGDDNENL